MDYQYQHQYQYQPYKQNKTNQSRLFVLLGSILLIFFALSYKQNEKRYISTNTTTNTNTNSNSNSNANTNNINNNNENPQSTLKDNPDYNLSNNYFTTFYNYLWDLTKSKPQSKPCTFIDQITGKCKIPKQYESYDWYCSSWIQHKNTNGKCNSSKLVCHSIDEVYGYCKQ